MSIYKSHENSWVDKMIEIDTNVPELKPRNRFMRNVALRRDWAQTLAEEAQGKPEHSSSLGTEAAMVSELRPNVHHD